MSSMKENLFFVSTRWAQSIDRVKSCTYLVYGIKLHMSRDNYNQGTN